MSSLAVEAGVLRKKKVLVAGLSRLASSLAVETGVWKKKVLVAGLSRLVSALAVEAGVLRKKKVLVAGLSRLVSSLAVEAEVSGGRRRSWSQACLDWCRLWLLNQVS